VRILFTFIISLFMLIESELSMSSAIIRKITYYNEFENTQQVETISAVMRIIGKETTFIQEKKSLGEINLFHPKNPKHPILIAYSRMKISGVKFHRSAEKEDWSIAEIYPSGGQRNAFQIHLPSFKNEYFKELNLDFEKKYAEKMKNPYRLKEEDPADIAVHIFRYTYKSRNKIELNVEFRILDENYKIGDTYPKHFDFVRISRKQ
jgi:hypothetical protein